MNDAAERLAVLHSSPKWLARTQTWMHRQIVALPDTIAPHVVCERTENLDAFPVPHLHSATSTERVLAAAGRRFGLRRHHGPMQRALRASGARVLHSHFGHVGWLDARFAAEHDLAHVVTFYGQDVHRLPRTEPIWRDRYAEMFASVDRVLCEGEFMAASVRGLGCPDAKVQVHRLGIDLERLTFRERERTADAPLRVLMCATFTEKKGYPDAFAALAIVAADRPVEVTIIGDATEDPSTHALRTELHAAAERAPLAGHCHFLGFRPHDDILRRAYEHDVFLHPSRTAADGDCEGGAPVGLIEMAATGLPIVSTTHCDIPGVLPDGCGWLSDEGDIDGLASSLRHVATDPDAAADRATAARQHIEHAFDARRQGEALAAIYAELANDPPSPQDQRIARAERVVARH